MSCYICDNSDVDDSFDLKVKYACTNIFNDLGSICSDCITPLLEINKVDRLYSKHCIKCNKYTKRYIHIYVEYDEWYILIGHLCTTCNFKFKSSNGLHRYRPRVNQYGNIMRINY
jgi:hypothetical protein